MSQFLVGFGLVFFATLETVGSFALIGEEFWMKEQAVSLICLAWALFIFSVEVLTQCRSLI